jgi:hypothetical protein
VIHRRHAAPCKRRRNHSSGARGTAAKRHELEGRKVGVPGFETAGEATAAVHVAITKYLEQIDALKNPNTHRKYEAALYRFGEFFRDALPSTRFPVTI